MKKTIQKPTIEINVDDLSPPKPKLAAVSNVPEFQAKFGDAADVGAAVFAHNQAIDFANLFLAYYENETDDDVTIDTLERAARAVVADPTAPSGRRVEIYGGDFCGKTGRVVGGEGTGLLDVALDEPKLIDSMDPTDASIFVIRIDSARVRSVDGPSPARANDETPQEIAVRGGAQSDAARSKIVIKFETRDARRVVPSRRPTRRELDLSTYYSPAGEIEIIASSDEIEEFERQAEMTLNSDIIDDAEDFAALFQFLTEECKLRPSV